MAVLAVANVLPAKSTGMPALVIDPTTVKLLEIVTLPVNVELLDTCKALSVELAAWRVPSVEAPACSVPSVEAPVTLTWLDSTRCNETVEANPGGTPPTYTSFVDPP